MSDTRARSAIFSSPDAVYHADRCEPLRAATRAGAVRLEALARRGYPGRPMPCEMLPEVSTIGFWDAPLNQSWGLDWHRNEGIELTYLSRGKLDFAVDRKRWRLENGHLTITRPWQEHRVGNPHVQASRLYWLILDVGVRRPNQPWRWPSWLVLSPPDLRRLTEMLRHNEQPVWPANAQLGRCFEHLAPLVTAPDPRAAQTWLQLRLNELFVVLYELLRSKRVTLDARLTSTRRTVEMFLASLPHHLERSWTLDEMARECGLARTRFAHHCQRITNLTPVQYLMRCRLEAAAKLLRERPTTSVTDAAYACGFSSSQYFATVFRRHFGCRPGDYRARGGG